MTRRPPRIRLPRMDSKAPQSRVTSEDMEAWQAFTRELDVLPKTRNVSAPIRPNYRNSRELPLSEELQPYTDHGRRRALETAGISRLLDLHGLTEAQAHDLLATTVENAVETGMNRLLIVTGKGRDGDGVLRRNVPRWLAGWGRVVAECRQATPALGGEGALIVVMKKEKE